MNQVYDAIIVGGGPAGLSSAIYLARAKYSVLVIEQEKIGGQITITSEVVNYPGVLEASGSSLTETMRKQAQKFGAEFKIAHVKSLNMDGNIKTIMTDQGNFQAIGVVLATGANPRKLGFKGEKEFQGRGIAYCATCDGEFFEGCELFVIGGGFAACEEAIFLTQYATEVTMIVREEDFTCAKTIAKLSLKLSLLKQVVKVFWNMLFLEIIKSRQLGVMMQKIINVLESSFLLDMFLQTTYLKIN